MREGKAGSEKLLFGPLTLAPDKFAAALQSASTWGKHVLMQVLMQVNYDNGHFTEDKKQLSVTSPPCAFSPSARPATPIYSRPLRP